MPRRKPPASASRDPERRRAILAAALACFNERGIEATGIDEICARAGASVGSVYHHFGSKEGIAVALLAEGLHRNARQLDERLRLARGARGGVQALVASLADWIERHPEWARFIYTISSSRLGQTPDPQLATVNTEYSRVLQDYFAAQRSAFRRLPAELLPSLTLGPVHDYARRWLGGQVTSPPTRHVERFAQAAWDAVRRPPRGGRGAT